MYKASPDSDEAYLLLSPSADGAEGRKNRTTASSLLDVADWVDEGWPIDGYGNDATESLSLFDHPKHPTGLFTHDGEYIKGGMPCTRKDDGGKPRLPLRGGGGALPSGISRDGVLPGVC